MTQAKNIVAQNAAQIAGVIDIRHGKPMVSSLRIAELFDRRHDLVLRAIRKELADEISLRKVEERDYVDARGKVQPMFWLDEECALNVMPYLGGSKSREGQRKLVAAYLFYRDNFQNPPRADILKDKRAAHNPMMDALIEFRADQGKETDAHHFQCENKLCNWVVSGEFKAIDEKTISNEDAAFLAKIRKRNEAYILAGLDYATRKAKLNEFAIRQRTKMLADAHGNDA